MIPASDIYSQYSEVLFKFRLKDYQNRMATLIDNYVDIKRNTTEVLKMMVRFIKQNGKNTTGFSKWKKPELVRFVSSTLQFER
jgi:hypothetical protein